MERERLQREGRLSVKEKEAKKLELKIRGLIESIRLNLDPLEEIAELEIDVAFQAMAELADAWMEFKQVQGEIKAIKKALGQ